MTVMNKQEFRRMLREIRGSGYERDVQSDAICRHILDSEIYRNARIIAGYCALPHEVDITKVLRTALAQGKTVALPLCSEAPEMTFLTVDSFDMLQPGRYGIPEPPLDAPVCNAAEVDLMLVPLEGIDPDGYRIGKGGGYYDSMLAKSNAYTMGCALSWQMVEELPRDEWDIPLNACAGADGMREYDSR